MAPKAFPAASEDSSHKSSLTSLVHMNGLELSFSSHSVAKPKTRLKKMPIIRVVHVFPPMLIKTNASDFRLLVQKLTGNRPDEEVAAEAKCTEQPTGHDHHAKQLEIRYQTEREPPIAAMLCTHTDAKYQDPFLHHSSSQAEVASNLTGFSPSNADFVANQARLASIEERDRCDYTSLASIEERDGYNYTTNYQGELALCDEGISYFPSANYDYDDAYSHDSSSSLDTSSSRGDSHNSYERDHHSCMFRDELDLMGAFNSSYPTLDPKLEFSLLNPTW